MEIGEISIDLAKDEWLWNHDISEVYSISSIYDFLLGSSMVSIGLANEDLYILAKMWKN